MIDMRDRLITNFDFLITNFDFMITNFDFLIGFIVRDDWTGDSKISDADRQGRSKVKVARVILGERKGQKFIVNRDSLRF